MTDKKIVSVSMIKNECDVLELCVRNNLLFLDELYIVVHKCSDTSLEILQSLKKEGLPIRIFNYNAYDYSQASVLTVIHNKIINEQLADFVLFCDADELIYAPSREIFRDALICEAPNSYLITAYNYDMTLGFENTNYPLYEKYSYRRNVPFTTKTISNIQYIKDGETVVCEGGHNTKGLHNGELSSVTTLPTEVVFLAHLPYRSQEQMLSKILVGCLSYNTREPNFGRYGYGVQWYSEFNRIMAGGENQVLVTNIPIVNESTVDFVNYTRSPILYRGELSCEHLTEVNALNNLVNFSLGYLKHHNDEEQRADIIQVINSIDHSNRYQSIYSILSVMGPYIEQKSMSSFDPSNLEELI